MGSMHYTKVIRIIRLFYHRLLTIHGTVSGSYLTSVVGMSDCAALICSGSPMPYHETSVKDLWTVFRSRLF